jgi:hypothetical protein
MSTQKAEGRSKTEGKLFAGVSSFKYLGNVINNVNRNDNCVKDRIRARTRAYFANMSKLKSKIISRAAKIQVYDINKICGYTGAETWTLTAV